METNCNVPELWNEHKAELKNFIRKRVKEEDFTNEILQEVLLKVYEFCISKSGIRNVRGWLFQIAQNTIIDHYRKNSKTTLQDEFKDFAQEDENQVMKEAENYILPMINFLPKEYAIPLIMADIDNMKQADIAQKLNLSLTATKSRIQRARQLLKVEILTCCRLETDKNGKLLSFEIKENCLSLQEFKKKK